jgi:spore coat protein U-like protein
MKKTMICLIAISALPISANAASSTTSLSVNASVGAVCTVSAQPVAFGAYDPVVANAAAALNGTGTVTVACTKGTLAAIDLGNGSNFNSGGRRMSGGLNFLNYSLYKDSNRTQAWGSGVSGGTTAAYLSLSKSNTDLTVYGQVAGGQDVAVGSYSDSVVATINY